MRSNGSPTTPLNTYDEKPLFYLDSIVNDLLVFNIVQTNKHRIAHLQDDNIE